ncbi:ankyrin repeat domain-containing protein [Parashewanella curva]|uniref:Ankyrin repeat domain-containing protein n=1 Tax=Parashewanella curva TaxID=2338552 RepID=A0A3L8PTY0_9GAMM|nr:ankyrin repeat domain-containing protein [Parashewanella curva]RLV58053.1 ankyrin repeat domain-containing protein [Parashewanella curva]
MSAFKTLARAITGELPDASNDPKPSGTQSGAQTGQVLTTDLGDFDIDLATCDGDNLSDWLAVSVTKSPEKLCKYTTGTPKKSPSSVIPTGASPIKDRAATRSPCDAFSVDGSPSLSQPAPEQVLSSVVSSHAEIDDVKLIKAIKELEPLSKEGEVAALVRQTYSAEMRRIFDEIFQLVKQIEIKEDGSLSGLTERFSKQLHRKLEEVSELEKLELAPEKSAGPSEPAKPTVSKEDSKVTTQPSENTSTVSPILNNMYQRLLMIERKTLNCEALQVELKGLVPKKQGQTSDITLDNVRRRVMVLVHPDKYLDEPESSLAREASELLKKLIAKATPQPDEIRADFNFTKEDFVDAFKATHSFTQKFRTRCIESRFVGDTFIEQALTDDEGEPISLEDALARKPRLQELLDQKSHLPIFIPFTQIHRGFMREVVAAKEDSQGRVWIDSYNYFKNYEEFFVHLCILHANTTKGLSLHLDRLLEHYPEGANCCEMYVPMLPKSGLRGQHFVQRSALMKAVDLNSPIAAKMLLKYGADPEEMIPNPDRNTQTGIIHAVKSEEMLQILIDNCPTLDLDKRDAQGSTLLHIIAHDQYCGETRYMRFAGQHLCHLSALLLDNGARVDIVDNKGNTPLHLACLDRNLTLVLDILYSPTERKELVRALSGNTESKSEEEKEAFTAVSIEKHVAQLPFLYLQNKKEQTPLMAAVEGGSTEILTVLLGAGLDPYAKDHRGYNVCQGLIYEILVSHSSLTKLRHYKERIVLHNTTRWVLNKMLQADPTVLERQLKDMLTIPISRASGFMILEDKVDKYLETLWNFLGGKKKWNGTEFTEEDEDNSCRDLALTNHHYSPELLQTVRCYMKVAVKATEVVEAAKTEEEKRKLRELFDASNRLTYQQQQLAIMAAPSADGHAAKAALQAAKAEFKKKMKDIAKGTGWFTSSKKTYFQEKVSELQTSEPEEIAEWVENYNKQPDSKRKV